MRSESQTAAFRPRPRRVRRSAGGGCHHEAYIPACGVEQGCRVTRVRPLAAPASIDLFQCRMWQRHYRFPSAIPPLDFRSLPDVWCPPTISALLGLALSLVRLEAELHVVRLRQSRAIQGDSQTGGTYAQCSTRYHAWRESDQASRCAAELGYNLVPFSCDGRLSCIWSWNTNDARKN